MLTKHDFWFGYYLATKLPTIWHSNDVLRIGERQTIRAKAMGERITSLTIIVSGTSSRTRHSLSLLNEGIFSPKKKREKIPPLAGSCRKKKGPHSPISPHIFISVTVYNRLHARRKQWWFPTTISLSLLPFYKPLCVAPCTGFFLFFFRPAHELPSR